LDKLPRVITIRTLWASRELLWTLVVRDLKARYRGSALGFFWSLANPLLLLAVYSVVFTSVLANRAESIQPYAVFLTTGLFPWVWTSTSLLEGAASLATNSGLIRKSVFPIEVLPAVVVVSNLVHFVFALPVLVLGLVISRILGFPVGGPWALLLPLLIVLHAVALLGLALGLAGLSVHFKDVRDLLANGLTLFFFLAPIIYPLSMIGSPLLRYAIRANPFTPFALAYQDVLFFSRAPSALTWAQMGAVALICWLLGNGVFRRLADTLAEAA
jgi:homopolymeric O-antigen transport system permease protein